MSAIVALRRRMDGRWTAELGDPTILGWLTVAAYFAAALMCARAARGTGRGPKARFERAFWLIALGAFVLLGINKQLDLQLLLLRLARAASQAQGWYGDRHGYQVAFVAVLALIAASVLVAMLWNFRRRSANVRLAAVGLVFTGAFVLLDAASSNRVTLWPGSSALAGHWGWLIELAGIAIVATAAARAVRGRRGSADAGGRSGRRLARSRGRRR